MTKDLKALIEDLRLNHEYCPKEVILQAADELERLAQPDYRAVKTYHEGKPVYVAQQEPDDLTVWKARALQAEAVIEKFMTQPQQDPVDLRTALAQALGCVYVCTRTWSAWGVGTMSQDDFCPAAESDEVLDSLVQAVITATPPPAAQQEPVAVIGSGFQLLWCREDWSKGLKVGDTLYTFPPQRKPLTVDEVWANDQLMSINAELNCSMDLLMEVARAIEAAHGIGDKT